MLFPIIFAWSTCDLWKISSNSVIHQSSVNLNRRPAENIMCIMCHCGILDKLPVRNPSVLLCVGWPTWRVYPACKYSALEGQLMRSRANLENGRLSDWVEFDVPSRHVIDHFGDESFQAITCTGINNQYKTNTQNQIQWPYLLSILTKIHKRKHKNTAKPLVSKSTQGNGGD